MVATAWSGSLNYATGIAPANAFGSAEIIASHPLHARHDLGFRGHSSAALQDSAYAQCTCALRRFSATRWPRMLS